MDAAASQLSSHLSFSSFCSFLLSMFDDSIEGIYDTLKAAAMISKQARCTHIART